MYGRSRANGPSSAVRAHAASPGEKHLTQPETPTQPAPTHGPAETLGSGSASWAWPAGVILALLYGSLIPFDFDPPAGRLAPLPKLPALELTMGNWEDLVINVVVYIPLGLALAVWGPHRRSPGRTRVFSALVIGTAVSLTAETMQTGIGARVASLLDVLLNACGAALGATLAPGVVEGAKSLLQTLRTRLADRPLRTVVWWLTLGLFLYHLAPFEFVTNAAALRESFLRAKWTILPLRSVAPHGVPFGGIVSQLTAAAWFAALGYVGALARREAGRNPVLACGSAIKHAFVLIVLIEFMQLFTRSHAFDLGAILLQLLAATLGAWTAIFLVDELTGSNWRNEVRLASPTLVLLLLALFQVLAILLSTLNFNPLGYGPLEPSAIKWLPFETIWQGSMTQAVQRVLSALAVYGTLAGTLVAALGRFRVRRAWPLTAVVVGLLAIAVEALQGITVPTPPDLTGPVLALLIVGAVARASAALGQAAVSAPHG